MKDRNERNEAAMFSQPKQIGELTLYPFTGGIRQLLERHGNPFANGTVSESARHQNELLFCFCHDGETLVSIPDDEWEREVTRFAFGLGMSQIEAIQQHIADEFGKMTDSTTETAPGKDQAATQA